MAAKKFLFNVDFGRGGHSSDGQTESASAQQAAVAEAEARGYAAGLAAAEVGERTEINRRCAVAFERAGNAFQSLSASFAELERRLEAEAVEVAFAVARKLAPTLVNRDPETEIVTLTTACLKELRTAPHIVVRVSGSQHATLAPELDRIARANGFEGRLVVLGEEDIAPGDCRLEWADGGVVRNAAATEATIGQAVARYITARRRATEPVTGE
jgi:flagellar assembly protein FliH